MQLTQVTSSNIKAIGHDGADLLISFNYGGTYRYRDVPAKVAADMLVAPSIGKFFHSEINKRYSFTKCDVFALEEATT